LNEGLVKIGCAAFTGCPSLTKVAVPSTLGIIQEGTFLNCDRLEEVFLPEGLTCIGNFSFANCECLSPPPTLPESIGSIGFQALPSAEKDVKGLEDVKDTKPAFVTSHHQVHLTSKGEAFDHVKVNARRELEIHSLQDQIEQMKLENSQFLAKLESIIKTKDGLEFEMQRYKQACQEDVDDDLSEASAAEELISVEGEMVSSLALDDEVQPDELASELENESSYPLVSNIEATCGNTFKSCVDEMVKLLGAPLRLPMKSLPRWMPAWLPITTSK
jgi:hypothetical protein